MRIPQIFSLSSSFSPGRMSAALLLSRNFITSSPQLMFERISMRYGDLKPIERLSVILAWECLVSGYRESEVLG